MNAGESVTINVPRVNAHGRTTGTADLYAVRDGDFVYLKLGMLRVELSPRHQELLAGVLREG